MEKQRIIGALDRLLIPLHSLPAHSAVTFCGDLHVHYLSSQVHPLIISLSPHSVSTPLWSAASAWSFLFLHGVTSLWELLVVLPLWPFAPSTDPLLSAQFDRPAKPKCQPARLGQTRIVLAVSVFIWIWPDLIRGPSCAVSPLLSLKFWSHNVRLLNCVYMHIWKVDDNPWQSTFLRQLCWKYEQLLAEWKWHLKTSRSRLEINFAFF